MLVTMLLMFGIELLDTVAVILGDASFDDMSMLTGMSVMRATSENRMQQHRRHRQNAGQGLKHEVFTVSMTSSRTFYVTSSHRQEANYPLNVKQVNPSNSRSAPRQVLIHRS